MRELAALEQLKNLRLQNTQVTDAGMKHLATLSRLETGLFTGTSVSQAGIDQVPSLVKSKGFVIDKPTVPVTPTVNSATDRP